MINDYDQRGGDMEYIDVITISRFKATCPAVLDKMKRTGQPVLVTRRGETIARIEPPPPPEASPHFSQRSLRKAGKCCECEGTASKSPQTY